MYSFIVLLYIIALAFGLLHLFLSAIITRKNMYLRIPENPVSEEHVSIFKPLKGMDDNLIENLRSYFELDYERYDLIFGLQSTADPALGVVKKLVDEYPHISSRIVVNDFEIGLNPKINNLYNMQQHARGAYVLISDSNTRVAGDFLKKMVASLQEPGVGMVTATIRGVGARQYAAAMENLHINSYISPNVFVARALSGIPVVIGKSILMRRVLLVEMGGFAAFKNYLAEDYLLGLKTRKMGLNVKTIPVLIDNVNESWPLSRFINRHTRWAKMRRHMHLHHYLIEAVSNPIAISFVLMLLLHNGPGLIQFFVIIVLKIMHDLFVSALLKSDMKKRMFLLVPLKDLIIGLLWYIPFFSCKVNWRENYFKIGQDSVLQPLST